MDKFITTYQTYKVSFFRAGLFRYSQELIYDISEGASSIRAKISNYIRKKKSDGGLFDETKVTLVQTFHR